MQSLSTPEHARIIPLSNNILFFNSNTQKKDKKSVCLPHPFPDEFQKTNIENFNSSSIYSPEPLHPLFPARLRPASIETTDVTEEREGKLMERSEPRQRVRNNGNHTYLTAFI